MSDFDIDDLLGWHVHQRTLADQGDVAGSERAGQLVLALESHIGLALDRPRAGKRSFGMLFEASVYCLARLLSPSEVVRRTSRPGMQPSEGRLAALLRQADADSEGARARGFEAVRALFPLAFGPFHTAVTGDDLLALGFVDLLGESGDPSAWRSRRTSPFGTPRPLQLAPHLLPSGKEAFDWGDVVDLYIAASARSGVASLEALHERRLRAAEEAFGVRIARSSEPTFDEVAWGVFTAATLACPRHQSPASGFLEFSLGPYGAEEQWMERALVRSIDEAEAAYCGAFRSCRSLAREAFAAVFSPLRETVSLAELRAHGMVELPAGG